MSAPRAYAPVGENHLLFSDSSVSLEGGGDAGRVRGTLNGRGATPSGLGNFLAVETYQQASVQPRKKFGDVRVSA